MDDLTLGGPSDVVAADLDYTSRYKMVQGYESEIISRRSRPRAAQFEGFVSVAPEEAELLGAHLYAGKKMDNLFENRCSDLNTAISRLSLLSADDALMLLKMSFSAPKMLHTLRCSPCVNHPCLGEFDNLLRKGIDTICNLSLTDIQWLQASLPVKDRGLGVRRVSSLAFCFSSFCRSNRRTPATAVISQLDHWDH